MALKTSRITITAEGRDQGKTFEITEMPALPLERMAYRAILILTRNGADIPDVKAGMASIVAYGYQSLMHMSIDEVTPLLDEMLIGIKICPDPRHPSVVRYMVDGDVEEVTTLFRLRMEWVTLHTGFSMPDAHLTSDSTTGSLDSSHMKTSHGHAQTSSRPVRRATSS